MTLAEQCGESELAGFVLKRHDVPTAERASVVNRVVPRARAIVDAAIAIGVEKIIITDPEFPSQNIDARDQRALAERGCYLERCCTAAHAGNSSRPKMFENMMPSGVRSSFPPTDLDQPSNPAVETGFALWADKLFEAGTSEDEVHTMATIDATHLIRA